MLSTLRHRVTLKPNVQTSDDQGSWTTGYPEEAWVEVWAALQPLSGREQAVYRSVESDINTKLIIRPGGPADGLTRDWLVEYAGVEYEIEAVVNPAFRNKLLTLLLKERS